MATVEHYKKKQECDNINRLLSYIKEKGSVSFTEGKAFLNVSSVTMSSYLKKLLEEKKIEHYYVLEPGKKRRKERYRIKPENQDKVNAQIGKYEAIKFIEGISNHIYVYREKDGKAIAAFISQIDKRFQDFAKGIASKIVEHNLKFLRVKLMPNQKIAVVIMVKGKEKESAKA